MWQITLLVFSLAALSIIEGFSCRIYMISISDRYQNCTIYHINHAALVCGSARAKKASQKHSQLCHTVISCQTLCIVIECKSKTSPTAGKNAGKPSCLGSCILTMLPKPKAAIEEATQKKKKQNKNKGKTSINCSQHHNSWKSGGGGHICCGLNL